MFPAPEQRERRYPAKVHWIEMRCVSCGRLLQKIERDALRPGKRIEIKCAHCKIVNYSVGQASTQVAF